MSIFDREEVYIGYSGAEYSIARFALKDAGIKYHCKLRRMGLNPLYPTSGNNYSLQLIISVNGKDADSARYFINKAIHGMR
jgi:hypothetical protein